MQKSDILRLKELSLLILLVFLAALFTACGDSANNTGDTTDPAAGAKALTLDLDLPNSVTGGPRTAVAALDAPRAASGTGMSCAFMGPEDDDPFRNGYEMTKFMVSAVATWTCFTDTLIELSASVPHDDAIHETDNDKSQPNYDPDDPTHYRVSDDSDTQTTIRFYYGYERDAPPTLDEDPQFFLSWNTTGSDELEGRLIIDGEGVNPVDRKEDDPVMMRMDFNQDGDQKYVDMFLRFDDGNAWAEGFRIQVTKDLTAGPLEKVFTALGLMEMKAQFLPTTGISEVPKVHMFTVADDFGNGAALAEFEDLSLPLVLNQALGNHLGNYLFDKDDIYFFDDDSDWDWIDKSITASAYRGGRTTPATGGSWIPFDPSQDMIANALNLGDDYFTGDKCAALDDDCTDLLNAVFVDGFAGQEPNQGEDPIDWRSDALNSPTYINSVYPNGSDWSGAFDYIFIP